jgi:hypothetical protein
VSDNDANSWCLTFEVRRARQLTGDELAGRISEVAQAGQARPAVGARLDRGVRPRSRRSCVGRAFVQLAHAPYQRRASLHSAGRPCQATGPGNSASGVGCEAADAVANAGWRNAPGSPTDPSCMAAPECHGNSLLRLCAEPLSQLRFGFGGLSFAILGLSCGDQRINEPARRGGYFLDRRLECCFVCL